MKAKPATVKTQTNSFKVKVKKTPKPEQPKK